MDEFCFFEKENLPRSIQRVANIYYDEIINDHHHHYDDNLGRFFINLKMKYTG